ncbi:hypothetical protein T484DRAFT_1741105 [Baffinella frigidus]|nr:hypothetical protein T484DRAFT_1741105 [Cryptophyta sp. CCMP2293]
MATGSTGLGERTGHSQRQRLIAAHEAMQDGRTKGLRGAQPRALKLKPFLVQESSLAGMPPTAMLRFRVQDVVKPGHEEVQHLGMDKLTLDSQVADQLVRLDWLGEMLRRPAPPSMHMIRIAKHLETPETDTQDTDRKCPRRSTSRARSPEVGDRQSAALSAKALALSNKLHARATAVPRNVGSLRDVRLLQRPRFELHSFTLLPELRGRQLSARGCSRQRQLAWCGTARESPLQSPLARAASI